MNELLLLFRYLPRSAAALLEGILPLRYCACQFAGRVPTWRLPADCRAAGLVTEGVEEVGALTDCDVGGTWISGPGGGVKRVRLRRKNPAHLARHGIFEIQSRPRVWKSLRVQDLSSQYHDADAKAQRVRQDDEAYIPVLDRAGVG